MRSQVMTEAGRKAIKATTTAEEREEQGKNKMRTSSPNLLEKPLEEITGKNCNTKNIRRDG